MIASGFSHDTTMKLGSKQSIFLEQKKWCLGQLVFELQIGVMGGSPNGCWVRSELVPKKHHRSQGKIEKIETIFSKS
jgi:hypothetical protein